MKSNSCTCLLALLGLVVGGCGKSLQTRVTGMTDAIKGQEVAKTKLGGLGIGGLVAAGALLIALIVSFASRPDGNAGEEAVSLKKQLDELTDEHVGLVVRHKGLEESKNELNEQFEDAKRKHPSYN